MFATLNELPMDRRAATASAAALRLLPSPDEDARSSPPEVERLVAEVRARIAREPASRVWAELRSAMAARTPDARAAAMSRLLKRGLVKVERLDLAIRPAQFRKFSVTVRRWHIEQAVRHAQAHEVVGLNRAYVLFLHRTSAERSLLVGATVTPAGLVFEWAFRINDNATDQSPVEALRAFVEKFGSAFSIDGGEPRMFVESEMMPLKGRVTVEPVPPLKHWFLSIHLGTFAGIGATEVNCLFVIDVERYIGSLQLPSDALSRWSALAAPSARALPA